MNNELVMILKKDMIDIKKIDKSDLRYFKDNSELNTHFYCIIKTNEYLDGVGLDLSLLLLETKLSELNTWDEFLNTITPYLVDSYRVSIPGYTLDGIMDKKQVYMIQPMNCDYMNIAYTHTNTPKTRNVKEFRTKLTDLVISKDKEFKINFNNCLASVNGLMCFPIVFEEELYLKDGAKALWSCTQFQQPDIVLLDFSPIGSIKIIKFSDLEHTYQSGPGNLVKPKTDIEIKLPDGVDLSGKTLFMVLANTLYFPNQITVTSNKIVYLQPEMTVVHSSLLMNDIATQDTLYRTQIARPEISVSKYFTETIWDPKHTGAYFVLVDNPNISIARQHMQKDTKQQTFVSHTEDNGIAINQATQKITSYVRHEYNKCEVNYISDPFGCYRLDHGFHDIQTGIMKFNCAHNNIIPNYADSYYEMVHIVGGS